MTMGARGTWRSTLSATSAGRRAVACLKQAAEQGCCYSGEPLPECEPDVGPGLRRSFVEALDAVARTAGASQVYDSRLEILCARWRVQAEPRRESLRSGRTVSFCKLRDDGVPVPVHIVTPDQVK